jgi:hypothetical protein
MIIRSFARLPVGWKTTISTVVISIVASALWEALVRPGAGVLGQTLVRVFSFVSSAYLDGIFRNAVMDPAALPALMLLGIFLISIPGAVAMAAFIFPARLRSRRHARTIAPADETRPHRLLRRATRVGAVIFLLLSLLAVHAYYNASVWTSRVMRNDLVLCKPYMSSYQFDLIGAEFAAVQSKDDFTRVHRKLEAIAKQHQVNLTEANAWYIQ